MLDTLTIANEIDAIRDSIILLIEYDDQTFKARASAQKALSLASTTLKEFHASELPLRFALDALGKSVAALLQSGEDESATLAKIEDIMHQL